MKTDNLSFVILGIILVVFAFWSASDTSFSSLKGIEHQETLKKITQCENSKTDKSFETYMTISSQFDICLLYTSDAADDSLRVDLGGRRIIKKNLSM